MSAWTWDTTDNLQTLQTFSGLYCLWRTYTNEDAKLLILCICRDALQVHASKSMLHTIKSFFIKQKFWSCIWQLSSYFYILAIIQTFMINSWKYTEFLESEPHMLCCSTLASLYMWKNTFLNHLWEYMLIIIYFCMC